MATCCTLLNVLTIRMWELCIVVDLYHWLYSSPWGDRTNMFSGLKNIWVAEFRNILWYCSEHHLSNAYCLCITILYVLCSHTCTIIGIHVLKSDYPCFASIFCCIVTKMPFSSVSSFPILSHSQEASYISSCLVLTHKSTISPPAAPPIMIGSTGVEFVWSSHSHLVQEWSWLI